MLCTACVDYGTDDTMDCVASTANGDVCDGSPSLCCVDDNELEEAWWETLRPDDP